MTICLLTNSLLKKLLISSVSAKEGLQVPAEVNKAEPTRSLQLTSFARSDYLLFLLLQL